MPKYRRILMGIRNDNKINKFVPRISVHLEFIMQMRLPRSLSWRREGNIDDDPKNMCAPQADVAEDED